MTLYIFRYGNWSGAMTVHKLLLLIVSVLRDPMLDDHPTNDEANDVYESDLELFEQMAMAWTWEYSSTPIISYLPPVKKDKRRLEVNGCVAAVARRSAREAEEWLRRYEAETSGIQFGDVAALRFPTVRAREWFLPYHVYINCFLLFISPSCLTRLIGFYPIFSLFYSSLRVAAARHRVAASHAARPRRVLIIFFSFFFYFSFQKIGATPSHFHFHCPTRTILFPYFFWPSPLRTLLLVHSAKESSPDH